MAWVLILTMAFGTAGFAFLSSTSFSPTNPTQQQSTELPAIVERALTPAELSLALRQGKVVFRSSHSSSCAACASADASIERFALQYRLFTLFEKQVDPLDNSSRLDAIGGSGRIVDLSNQTLTQDALLDQFCSLAPLQPRECIARSIAATPPPTSEPENQTNETTANQTANTTADQTSNQST